ncbi:hypothetical protein [Acrocarpospora sp. B8E8]|uniref:hypothetical protein n=1 Tax=Acrocarpospora sp. B8E8 TaxID=3153572 RepID=UPI00325F28AE
MIYSGNPSYPTTARGAGEPRTIAPELLDGLRRLGDTYGALGVALAAATLTDADALRRELSGDRGAAEEPEPSGIGHAVVELLGHRRVGAYVSEATIAGASFLRLDVPATPGHDAMTQYVSPGSVYCLTPTTQEIAHKAAAIGRPAPVSRWELETKPYTAADCDEDRPY